MSSDAKKQLKIKAGVCRRLGKEVQLYVRELAQYEAKVQALREEKADKHDIKKAQEFLSETAAVLADTRSRTDKALAELRALLDASGGDVEQSEEYAEAVKAVDEVEAVLDGRTQSVPPPVQRADPSSVPVSTDAVLIMPRSNAEASAAATVAAAVQILNEKPGVLKIAVYGSSRCSKGDPLWNLAEQVGAALSGQGFHVITGGYSGTMEAVSLGARKNAGTIVEGIIAPKGFPHRGHGGNEHLNLTTVTESLQDRITLFTSKADAFVVLPGNVGTLTELVITWNVSIVNRFSGTPALPLFAFRDPWEKFLQATAPLLGVDKEDLSLVQLIDSPEDLVAKLLPLQQKKLASVATPSPAAPASQ